MLEQLLIGLSQRKTIPYKRETLKTYKEEKFENSDIFY